MEETPVEVKKTSLPARHQRPDFEPAATEEVAVSPSDVIVLDLVIFFSYPLHYPVDSPPWGLEPSAALPLVSGTSLPPDIRNIDSVSAFKTDLKTYLFRQAFGL